MKWLICILLVKLISAFAYPKDVFYYQPRHVHLAYGENTSDIVVTWSTLDDTGESIVEYGENDHKLRSNGSSKLFVDGGKKKLQQFIHKVTLYNLKANTKYTYHCGSDKGWSAAFWFKTPAAFDSNWSPRFAIFGDMGNENARSLSRLQEDTFNDMYDAILHVGDFAYDMDTDDGRVGDEFMNQIESIAAYLPYMVVPGNHEEKYNFSNYRARFNMPGGTENLFYSFDLGPVHFIGINSEAYYNFNYGIKLLTNQYAWLEADLTKANHNRIKVPWIVTMAHRPMYCSDNDGDDCLNHETIIRVGLPIVHWFGLEELFYKHGVDVEIWAHEHSYERLWPIYDYKVYNGSLEHPYTNPRAPVHIITGSAGCKEDTDNFIVNPGDWSAFRSSDYGYTRMNAHNKTHLYFEQVSDNQNGKIIDSFWVIKHTHGSYSN